MHGLNFLSLIFAHTPCFRLTGSWPKCIRKRYGVYQDESTPLWVRPRIGCFTGPLGLYAWLGHGARWLSQWNEEICELLKALPNFL
jgi:hypothetical protein